MSKREREDERPDETPVTMIDLQAPIYARNRPTFVTFANANSNRFQYGIIYSIFSCFSMAKNFFRPPNCGPGLHHSLGWSPQWGPRAEPLVRGSGGFAPEAESLFAFGRLIMQYFAVFISFSADNCMTLPEIESTW